VNDKPANPPAPRELKAFQATRQLLSARFSPCGQFLCSGAMDQAVHRWSVVEKKPAAELELPDAAKKPAPKNAKNAPKESPVELTPLAPITGFNGWVSTIAFHPTDKLLFAADSWGKLVATSFEGETPNAIWHHAAAHDGWIRRVAVSNDGKLIATCGRDRFVRIWNAADGKPVAKHEHSEDVFVVNFTPDGSRVVFGDTFGKIGLLDFKSAKIERQFDASTLHKLSRIQDVAGLRVLMFLDEGRTLVAAGCQPKDGGFVEGGPAVLFFNIADDKLIRESRIGSEKDGFVHDLAWHPGGWLMAATSGQPGNGKLMFLRPDEKEPFYTNTSMANCHSVALHPDKRRFIVTATNRNSSGNGRPNSKDGAYPSNNSPIHLFELPA
jgi:WD40 repeat protein